MASTLRGNNLAAKQLIHYGDGSYNADGTAQTSVFYAVLTSALVGQFPTVGTTTHPLYGGSWKCSTYRWQRVAPNVTILEIVFTAPISVASSQIEQEFDNIAELEPITSHASFATFAGSSTAPANGAVWLDAKGVAFGQSGYDSTSGRFTYFGPGAFYGLENYLLPKGQYQFAYNATTLPIGSDVGKIAAAPTGAPTLPGAATWLLTARTWRRTASSIWRIVETYRASGPAGWNAAIYT